MNGLDNGIDVSKITPRRVSYRADERGRNILFIGRLTDKSRLEVLVESLRDIRGGKVRLHVIGGGKNEERLKRLALELGVHEQIEWHGEIVEEEDIASIANSCALFVYPGQVGLSLIHGMAYGLPSVVHNQPLHHMPEIAAFRAGVTGESFEEGSSVSLGRTLTYLLNFGSEREAMSVQCYSIVEERFNTQKMIENFSDSIDKMAVI
ncbi:glycosyltransferase family 4 protein [Qipengyuania flava]|uniref:glycosyltransferase family 4 protein n=1 Tax=Qipengyuania flava TaxID=192812 RepID=UPI0012FDA263|nr:glycosyltransferase [Qipengyuania flava]